MSERAVFTADQACDVGEAIGIDWATSRFDVGQLRMGMDLELNEFPDYYSRLVDARTVGDGLVFLTCQFVQKA